MKKTRLTLLLCLFAANMSIAQKVYIDTPAITEQLGSNFEYIVTEDINDDGLTDLVGATTYNSDPANDYNILVWLQGANGHLLPPQKTTYHSPATLNDIVITKLDTGQNPKIILSVDDYLFIYSWKNNSLILEDSIQTLANDQQTSIATGDLDRDGLTDIAVSHQSLILTVLFQNAHRTPMWDIKHDTLKKRGATHLVKQMITGKFGSIKQTSLITLSDKRSEEILLLTYGSSRNIKQTQTLEVPTIFTNSSIPHSMTLVGQNDNNAADTTGKLSQNELWVSAGLNKPSSAVYIWRDVQNLPDSTFKVNDFPEAIKAADLNCDGIDDIVLLHANWLTMSVIATALDIYNIKTPNSYNPESLAIGDINNDGANDICIANRDKKENLVIFYNSRPCWPASTPTLLSVNTTPTIYPNPTNNDIRITSDKVISTISVQTISGKTIKSYHLNKKVNTIQMKDMPAGIYLLHLTMKDGTVHVKKVVKE